MAAPFFSVNFADFWLGDQFNSMTIVFVDFKNLLCFCVRNPFLSENYKHEKCEVDDVAINACVSCLPAWLRFAQCLRQYRDNRKPHPYLTNAGKYATVFPTILFAALTNAYRGLRQDKVMENDCNFHIFTFFSPFYFELFR